MKRPDREALLAMNRLGGALWCGMPIMRYLNNKKGVPCGYRIHVKIDRDLNDTFYCEAHGKVIWEYVLWDRKSLDPFERDFEKF